ncbi:4Fe-4S binding protein [Thermodesulfatator atlanticus]|uniref:4Fe-4S binding protein n=1 Tax=Thermodesulfatator atlanticus TaxID=501497 RepID=UPI0003B592FC|nr:4Fe-4S binding protein [Thermodesulfatator atlanticus]
MNLKLLKEILRVLFVYDPEARLDLFTHFPRLKSFFANRRNFAILRTFGDIIFTCLILMGLFGPQDPSSNIMLFISWGVWWTSIVLSWFFVGRMWCGVCPFPGVGRILQALGLYRKKLPLQTFAKWCAYGATGLLALILWVEAVTHMKNSPFLTALLLLSILLGATIFAALYKGQAWCRHFCPMGKIIGSAATMSILEFRPLLDKCRGCKTFACKRGKDGIPGCPVYLGAYAVKNNLICLVCGHCVPLCDRDSPRLFLRHPLKELILNKGRYLTCAYIIPFLMASQISRFIQERTYWYQSFKEFFGGLEIISYSLVLAACFVLFLGIIRLGAHLFTFYEDELFGKFSPMVPVLVPMAFTGELVYRLDYFLKEVGNFFPILSRQFHIQTFASWGFVVPEWLIVFLLKFVLVVGGIGATYVSWVFYSKEFEGLVPKKNFFAILLLIWSITLLYLWLV